MRMGNLQIVEEEGNVVGKSLLGNSERMGSKGYPLTGLVFLTNGGVKILKVNKPRLSS